MIVAEAGNQSAQAGGSAKFRVTAENTQSYQWQTRSAGGEWVDVPGATNQLLTVSNVTLAMDGAQYRVAIGGGGKFVFSATEAYEIENGKLGRPLKGASLVGTGFEALKRITMVGDDSALDGGIGSCGKNGQSVPVGVGQPTMRLENMTVGGAGTGEG